MGKTWGAIIAPDAVIENFIYEDYDTPSIEYIGKYLNLGALLLLLHHYPTINQTWTLKMAEKPSKRRREY